MAETLIRKRRRLAGLVRRPRLLLAVSVTLVVSALWYQHTRPSPVFDVSPPHPERVGLGIGSFRGIHLGEGPAAVVRTLGRPVRTSDFPSPTEASEDAQLPSGPGDAVALNYRDMAVDMVAGRVVLIVITSPNAQTRLGVNVGDSLGIARRAYPNLTCAAHDQGVDEPYGPPFCYAHLHAGVNIELIGDPILTIVVHGRRSSQP